MKPKRQKKQKNFVLLIQNYHSSECGKPPSIISDVRKYTGYFQNSLGEQMVFIYDYDTHKGYLYGGDWGWEKPYEITEKEIVPYRITKEGRDELILSKEEQRWLSLCWDVAISQEQPKKEGTKGKK